MLIGAAMVAGMVIIGGITRLTQSGLSMVEWKLFMGMIPPLNEHQWTETFAKYQQYPEYQLINHQMTLEEFKSIFFWEWLHRFIGRTIGIVFLLPFLYFLIKEWLTPKLLKQTLFLFFLGGLQGFLGWFMVKSGLKDLPHVSHFRLAIHLIAALTTYAYILWVVFGLTIKKQAQKNTKNIFNWNIGLLVVLVLQIIFGAFVAGLKAGKLFPTFPKMGDHWIAPAVGDFIDQQGISTLFNQAVSVQFIHRYLAYFVILFASILWWKSRKTKLNTQQKKAIVYILLAVGLQFILGVFTLLYRVPVVLGVVHQFGALILLSSTIYSLYLQKPPAPKNELILDNTNYEY